MSIGSMFRGVSGAFKNAKASMQAKVAKYKPQFDKVNKHVEKAKDVVDRAEEAKNAYSAVKTAVDAVRKGASEGVYGSGAEAAAEVVSWGALSGVGKVKITHKIWMAIRNVTKMKKRLTTEVKEVRDAVKTGSGQEVAESSQKVLGTMKETVDTAQRTMRTASTVASLFGKAGPAVGRAMAKLSMTGSGARVAAAASIQAASFAGVAAASARVTGAIGRFMPGVNMCLAVLDTGIAIAVLADRNARRAKKVLVSLTAVGSVLAAGNTPVVSQAGAALAAVTTFASAFVK